MLSVGASGAIAAEPDRDPYRPDLEAIATATESELVKSIAIERRAGPSRTSVLSLRLPDLESMDGIRVSAEVTVTNTCVERSRRCIGRRYSYSPKVGAQLRLASRRTAAGKAGSVAFSPRRSLACRQQRPDRNHHCPITFSLPKRSIDAASLPCAVRGCRLNLVLDAHHRKARRGDRLVVGADRPDGSIVQGRGRINAIAFREGFDVTTLRSESRRRRHGFLRMVRGNPTSRTGGHTVTYSARVPSVERGTVISADAHQRLAIGHLPYSAFISTELILASRPGRTSPDQVAKRAATFNGHLTETNGFNCTQGPSAFRTPCDSHKAGTVQLRRTPTRNGEAVPLFVNLVSRTFPKRTAAHAGDRAKIRPGGSVDVVAYPPFQKPD